MDVTDRYTDTQTTRLQYASGLVAPGTLPLLIMQRVLLRSQRGSCPPRDKSREM